MGEQLGRDAHTNNDNNTSHATSSTHLGKDPGDRNASVFSSARSPKHNTVALARGRCPAQLFARSLLVSMRPFLSEISVTLCIIPPSFFLRWTVAATPATMAVRTPKLWWLYYLLCCLRVLFAVFGNGYVHPDEHFQASEIAAADVFRLRANETLTPWEFSRKYPIRSALPIALLSHAPFALVAYAAKYVSPAVDLGSASLVAQRLWSCAVSFIVDWALLRLSRSRRVSPVGALLVVASSWVSLVLLVRPFSNAGETVVSAVAVYLVFRKLSHNTSLLPRSIAVGFVLCLGVFVRFTFVAIAAPLAICTLVLHSNHQASTSLWWRVTATACGGVAGAIVAAALGCFVDTLYFHDLRNPCEPPCTVQDGDFGVSVWGHPLRVTPWRAIEYNMDADNLATHGLHPRWVHAVVNGPMMFGLSYVLALTAAFQPKREDDGAVARRNLPPTVIKHVAVVATVYMAVLSSAPHQEARFLAPLLVPVALLVSVPP